MKILALTNLYPNPYQPHRAPFTRHQFRLLARHHDIEVIAPIAWTDELLARRRGSAPLPDGRQVVRDGLQVTHPRYFFPPRVLRGSYGSCFLTSVRATFSRAVARFKPDLLFTPWAYPDGWAAVQLGHRARLPVVLQVHGSDILLLPRYPARRRRTIEAVRAADGIIAVSHDLARNVTSLGVAAERIRVIHDGVDTSLFHPGSQTEARSLLGLDPASRLLLFVGNLVPVKGIELLITVCQRLRNQGIALHVSLIGEGPLRPALQRSIDRHGLRGSIRLMGAVTQPLLPNWYRSADVFVLPSYSEGVPNVLLEAAACGTPFVSTRVGGIPEIADRGLSWLVAPGDVDALTKAVSEALAAQRPSPIVQPKPREAAVGEAAEFLEHVLRTSVRRQQAISA